METETTCQTPPLPSPLLCPTLPPTPPRGHIYGGGSYHAPPCCIPTFGWKKWGRYNRGGTTGEAKNFFWKVGQNFLRQLRHHENFPPAGGGRYKERGAWYLVCHKRYKSIKGDLNNSKITETKGGGNDTSSRKIMHRKSIGFTSLISDVG